MSSGGLGFLPVGCASSSTERWNVEDVSETVIRDRMKAAKVSEQVDILKDLICLGKDLETAKQRGLVSLAAKLYVEAPKGTQEDFLLYLIGSKPLFKIFVTALKANAIYHRVIEGGQKGSSGLSPEQLDLEQGFVRSFEQFL